ncbi:MAG TPA: FkbM family methyltransferase [Planctomycetota bacterium]|nr:FkbM family methyltransferase [Planctomycetota bacterium]
MTDAARAPLLSRLPWTKIKLGIASTAYHLARPFLGNRPRIIVRGGIRYRIDLSEAIDFALFLAGNFQGYITHSGRLALPADGILFDVGANIGSTAMGLARQVPQGRVYAFEPTHSAFGRLKDNLALNPELSGRVTPIQVFLSDRTAGEPGLVAYSSWKLDGSRKDRHPLHGGSLEGTSGISSVTLDEFCRDRGVVRMDLLKIDTDGHELAVLRGARETLGRLRPPIIFEVGLYILKERGVRIEEYFDLLDPMGYRWTNMKTGHPVTRETARSEIPLRSTTDILALPPGR